MFSLRNVFLLFLAFFSVYLGATFMQISLDDKASKICEHEASCQLLMKKNSAKELYEKAFKLSFIGSWQEAAKYAECSAHVARGMHGWRIEAKNI